MLSDESAFAHTLLQSCACDQISFSEHQSDFVPNVVIGAEVAALNDQQLQMIGAMVDCTEEKLPENLFNVEFISPRMLDFIEKPRSTVYLL